ncbi:hypothetical protein SEPCBS119000_005178 [Sporothrix epigloea]|uniref:Microsomal epoxide hydrolase n=1 Tax=Sporothrix epigloea TaxID=1892477 RepID=A0ABP0DW55_9PEZI
MADAKQPKVILFDIGGVCVASPFQTILDYELSLGIPPGWINFSISQTAPNGFWHRLERGHIPLDAAFLAGFTRDLNDEARWQAFYQAAYQKRKGKADELPLAAPPKPNVDGELLFNRMMRAADVPDPWMLPALQTLSSSGRYILAALSNTVIFPPGHELHSDNFFAHPVRRLFDVFISSAHVGLRKPEPAIYQMALRETNAYAQKMASTTRGMANGWKHGVTASDILFLDDIGENLKFAKEQGFRTLKVELGRSYEAVDRLEEITGLKLHGSYPRPHDKARM